MIRISRNLPDFDALKALEYGNSINKLPFLGLRSFSTRCVKLDGTRIHENGKLFWRWDAEFHARVLREPTNNKRITPLPADEPPDSYRSWTAWLLNQGYVQKPLSGTGAPEPVLDKLGNVSSQPLPLDEDGRQLAWGENPLFLGFDYLYEKDFNELGLTR